MARGTCNAHRTSKPVISSGCICLPLKAADQRAVVLTRASGQNKSCLSSTCLGNDVNEGSGVGFILLKARL